MRHSALKGLLIRSFPSGDLATTAFFTLGKSGPAKKTGVKSIWGQGLPPVLHCSWSVRPPIPTEWGGERWDQCLRKESCQRFGNPVFVKEGEVVGIWWGLNTTSFGSSYKAKWRDQTKGNQNSHWFKKNVCSKRRCFRRKQRGTAGVGYFGASCESASDLTSMS